MLQLLKKLKLYTKLGPETVHKYSHQNFSGNAPGRMKYPYFDTIISPTLKNCKWLKICAGSANFHALQSFEVFFQRKNKFLFVC